MSTRKDFYARTSSPKYVSYTSVLEDLAGKPIYGTGSLKNFLHNYVHLFSSLLGKQPEYEAETPC